MGRFIQKGTGVVVSVDDSKDERFENGWKRYTDEAQTSDVPDKSWKVADLKAFAEENGIDLLDASKKDDILAAIELHEPASSESESDENESEESGE